VVIVDAATDESPDVTPDAEPDTEPDADPDVAPDAASPDLAPDATPDSGTDATVVLPPGADLAVGLTQTSTATQPLHVGDKVTITARVRNNGPSAAGLSWVDVTWPNASFNRDTSVNAQGVTVPPGAQIFSQSNGFDEVTFTSIAVGAEYVVQWHFVVKSVASASTTAAVAASTPADMVQANNQLTLTTPLTP
jgi:hypothetical protein